MIVVSFDAERAGRQVSFAGAREPQLPSAAKTAGGVVRNAIAKNATLICRFAASIRRFAELVCRFAMLCRVVWRFLRNGNVMWMALPHAGVRHLDELCVLA